MPAAHPLLLPAAVSQQQLQCQSLINMHLCLAGVLLPTLMAANMLPSTWRDSLQEAPHEPAQPAAQEGPPPLQQRLQPPQPQRQHWAGAVLTPAGRWARYGLAAAEQGWGSVEGALTDCCRGTGYNAIHLLMCAWLLMGNMWLCSKAASTGGTEHA